MQPLPPGAAWFLQGRVADPCQASGSRFQLSHASSLSLRLSIHCQKRLVHDVVRLKDENAVAPVTSSLQPAFIAHGDRGLLSRANPLADRVEEPGGVRVRDRL